MLFDTVSNDIVLNKIDYKYPRIVWLENYPLIEWDLAELSSYPALLSISGKIKTLVYILLYMLTYYTIHIYLFY